MAINPSSRRTTSYHLTWASIPSFSSTQALESEQWRFIAVKRILLVALLSLSPCLSALAGATKPTPGASLSKPSLLFIAVDDLNDWIGVMGGHPQSKTPNIDRLAGMGILFDNAHCAAPACNPSRAALLWGIRPSTSGVYLNSQPIGKAPHLQDKPTLPQWMSQHGYRSVGSGKIFHRGPGKPQFWDHYESLSGSGNPGRKPANRIPGSGNLDWGPTREDDEV
ncbi:MAG: sulfatase-like hydrolase/transferase, partial [Akkermansiaceae bacterium]|nr:sulfatase-like hydrolase/transferase [Akkermansiaceae bacterium]